MFNSKYIYIAYFLFPALTHCVPGPGLVSSQLFRNSGNIYNLVKNLRVTPVVHRGHSGDSGDSSFQDCQDWWRRISSGPESSCYMFYTCVIDREGRVARFAFKCSEGFRLRDGECVEEAGETEECDTFEVVRITPDFLVTEEEYV